jgi:diguanylate cyclase (GGDEF)-like protein/PAS domain S-box-containing protein
MGKTQSILKAPASGPAPAQPVTGRPLPVLLVESSSTRQHVLRRVLLKRFTDITACRTPVAAIQLLRTVPRESLPAVLLLGLEVAPQPYTDELFALLTEPAYADLTVLVLAHTAEPAVREWTSRRPRSAMLLWEDFTDSADCLAKLLAPPKPLVPEDSQGEPIRILLVDDSRTVRMTYQRLLAARGYRVETAASAAEAYARVQSEHFDIAIIDYFMPEENGDVLCRRLQSDARTRSVTPAILTGTYNDQVIQECLKAGAVECMFKNEAHALFLARLDAMSRAVRSRKSVEAERSRLAGILTSVGDGVYGVDREGRVTFINPAACRILGYHGAEELVGEAAARLFHGNPQFTAADQACPLQEAYTTGSELSAWETVFRHRDGQTVPVECTVYPLRIEGQQEGSVVAFRDVSERRALQQELVWQAHHDPLTQLHNRRYFEQQLEEEVQRCRRGSVSALLYLDLDRFKYINDTAGHAAGDQLLIEIAQQMNDRLRDADLLARLGGDEFAVILRNVNAATAMQAAESFREVLERYTFMFSGNPYRVYGSIGVAMMTELTPSAGEVLVNADIACHLAKNKGRNQTHLYQPDGDAKLTMNIDLGWSTRLEQALKTDRFVLHYQPIVPLQGVQWPAKSFAAMPTSECGGGLADNGVFRCEVLIRLADQESGIISPNAFLPTAERFGLMPHIDLWVIQHAILHLSALQKVGQRACLAVNLSGHTLDDQRLVPEVKRLLAEHNVNPESLSFEITETNAIANMDAAQRLITELREHGCRFALDDFGSGFSSFHHLKNLPVDLVKIDGQFVRGMVDDAADRAIVISINDIAHSFGKRTVAEFVENQEILEMLQEFGVDYAQGYYISPPRQGVIGTA